MGRKDKQRYNGFESTTDVDRRTRNNFADPFNLDNLGDIPITTDRDKLERGAGFSVADAYKMRYDYAMWQKQNAYNEKIYNQYQSPKALMDQYQQAGINPMLVAGGSMPQGSLGSDSAPDSSSATGVSPQTTTDKFQQILGVISSLFGVGSQISQAFTSAKTRKQNQQFQQQELDLKGQQTAAQVAKTTEETKGLEIDNRYKSLEKSLDIAFRQGQITKQEKESALLDFNVQVNKNVTPEVAANNILTQYQLDKAHVAKTEAETANLTALTNRLNTLLSSEIRSYQDSHNLSVIENKLKELEKHNSDITTRLRQAAFTYGVDVENTAAMAGLSVVLSLPDSKERREAINQIRDMSFSNSSSNGISGVVNKLLYSYMSWKGHYE